MGMPVRRLPFDDLSPSLQRVLGISTAEELDKGVEFPFFCYWKEWSVAAKLFSKPRMTIL